MNPARALGAKHFELGERMKHFENQPLEQFYIFHIDYSGLVSWIPIIHS
jgi:hypothetical protein